MDENGDIMGFTIGHAQCPALEVPYDPEDPGIFSLWRPHHTELHPEVFEDMGTRLLKEALSAEEPLILLDEIGGSELLSPSFSSALYRVLESDRPCVGVLKGIRSARNMVDRGKLPVDILDESRRLHGFLEEDPSTCVIPFSRETADRAGEILSRFLDDI